MPNDLDPRSEMDPKNPKILNRVVFPAGREIIRQGEEGNKAFYIESGSVEVLVEDGPHLLKVSELKAGDIFGEMTLINQEPRTATVKAITSVTATAIATNEIETRIEGLQDKAIKALVKVLVTRLSEATKAQMQHYKNLSDFQDRITGIVDRANVKIDEAQRDAFRNEVEPLLNDLQKILDKYGR